MTRRGFLGAGLGAAAAGLTGCGGFATQQPGGSGATDADSLSFTTWGTDSELAGLRKAIDSFQAANAGAKVALNTVPYEQMFTNIDAQLQAGNPPDVFRVPYYTLGAYAGRDQLLDMSSALPGDIADRFTPQAWAAVQSNGHPVGVPHHTDTSVILYNKDALGAAGVRTVPTKLEDAWTWDQLAALARTLRGKLPASKFPFVYNWQGNGVTRWLSLLFQAGGRFLADDLTTPAIDSDAGRAAVDFSKSFFAEKFVPPNSSVKSSTYAADIWYSQTAVMTFGGAFLIPDTQSNVDFEWGATFAPRKQRAGGDFGGNALVVTKATKKADLAAKFLDHVTQQQPMRDFCAGASLLPTRKDLIEGGLDFAVRPELAPVFLGQASTVRAEDSGQVASPAMAGIITVLKDQLEQAFVGGQSTAKTLTGISDGIAKATAR